MALAPDGVSAAQWITDVRSLYAERLDDIFIDLLERLERGDVHPETAAAFFDLHPTPKFTNALELRQERIENARTAAAPRWVRLIVNCNDPYPELLDFFEGTFRSRFPAESGYSLVVGPALTEAEQQATFKTLLVNARIDYAHFRSGGISVLAGANWDPPPVPILLECTFKASGSPGVRTSWDDLPSRESYLHPPNAISKAHIEAILDNYRTVLITQLEPKFKDLPPFFIFPDASPTPAAPEATDEVPIPTGPVPE